MYGTIKSVEEDERDGRTPVREISITSLLKTSFDNFIRIEKNIYLYNSK